MTTTDWNKKRECVFTRSFLFVYCSFLFVFILYLCLRAFCNQLSKVRVTEPAETSTLICL